MDKLMLVAFASVIAIAGSQALADGGTDSRPIGKVMSRRVDTVDKSMPMPCTGGSIEERVAESEGVPGFTYDYALGCMLDAHHAGWVIRAGLACFDTAAGVLAQHNPKPVYCDDPLVRALPAFNLSGDYWAQKTPPYAMRYQLIRYAVGSNCQRVDQRVHSEPIHGSAGDSTVSVWICESVVTYDGMLNAAGMHEADPALFHTQKIVTLSSQRMEFAREGVMPGPMLDFVVPKREYDCNLHLIGKRHLVCE